MSEPKPRVTRRLYSLYPEQIAKLEILAKARKMPQSQYLREIIDVAFAEYNALRSDDRKVSTHYGQDN